jgi:hypothetical protein
MKRLGVARMCEFAVGALGIAAIVLLACGNLRLGAALAAAAVTCGLVGLLEAAHRAAAARAALREHLVATHRRTNQVASGLEALHTRLEWLAGAVLARDPKSRK